jgi:hypothetical protein
VQLVSGIGNNPNVKEKDVLNVENEVLSCSLPDRSLMKQTVSPSSVQIHIYSAKKWHRSIMPLLKWTVDRFLISCEVK